MAYTAPYIDEYGMHIPDYNDILSDLVDSMKNIFGSDIYLDEDSMDYQQLSIFARKIYDTNSLAMLVYNNRTANTSIGVGLDNLCALVGIKRKPATYSECQLTITGDEGTVITNGKASDGTHDWNLPNEVTIPSNGSIVVQATCNDSGNVTAAPNTINIIATPLYGWVGVTNQYSATPGRDIESDANLRARYYVSTMLPASSIFDSLVASIGAISDVKRVKGYENDTNIVTQEGFPPHSVTFVVEGGEDGEIAEMIYNKKTPGCYTNGDTDVEVTSDVGNVTHIRFDRPVYQNVYVQVSLTKLTGFNDSTIGNIKQALVDYINSAGIADTIYRQVLISIVIGQLSSITSPEFSVSDVKISKNGITYTSSDLPLQYSQAAVSSIDKISVVVS
nr:MAG TPA: Baseplate J like protein [Caudoviricetes sp.]